MGEVLTTWEVKLLFIQNRIEILKKSMPVQVKEYVLVLLKFIKSVLYWIFGVFLRKYV